MICSAMGDLRRQFHSFAATSFSQLHWGGPGTDKNVLVQHAATLTTRPGVRSQWPFGIATVGKILQIHLGQSCLHHGMAPMS